MADQVNGDVDAYGPLAGPAVVHDADRRRHELDAEGLSEVSVSVVRLHRVGSNPGL